MASMDYGFFTDGQEPTSKDDGEHIRRATPLWVVKVKPIMMIWGMLVQCKGVEDPAGNQGNGRVVEQASLPGVDCQIRQWTDAVSRELKDGFGVKAIAQAPPKYDPVALAWYARFTGQLISTAVKGTCISARAWKRARRRSRSQTLLGIKEGSEEFVVGTFAGCVVCRTVQKTAS